MTRATPPMPTLDADRIRLRPYSDRDVDDLFALYSDSRVTRYWSFVAWTERAQAEAYLAKVRRERKQQEFYPWVIARRDDDRFIGTATLHTLSREHARCEVGYSLMSAHWGHGYVREALSTALNWAFETLKLERIEADIDPRNRASCCIVEDFGFRQEGMLRGRWRVAGEITDSAIYGLLRDEFVPWAPPLNASAQEMGTVAASSHRNRT